MQPEESRTDLGVVKIHKNVIASIASLSALRIEGVRRIGGGLFRSGLAEIFGKYAVPAVRVEISKNEEVRVEIPLVVDFGFNIPEVANKVQESVRSGLEKMTNLSVKDININVQAIEKPQKEAK
ncbi:MAG: hypothetical protein A3G38_02540 [Omnitrophica WOR_2 bacterium RIFCSPLOWO2_12_FULL_51_8]|nr:MAG: hypothetical protein A3G38_02540 [Omnitrophica WOR_2 bacterium RIFCSPLOWO2_12_FULL_51_8]